MPYIDCPLHDSPQRVESPSELGFCLAVIGHMVAHCRTPVETCSLDVLAPVDQVIKDFDVDAEIDIRARIEADRIGNR